MGGLDGNAAPAKARARPDLLRCATTGRAYCRNTKRSCSREERIVLGLVLGLVLVLVLVLVFVPVLVAVQVLYERVM